MRVCDACGVSEDKHLVIYGEPAEEANSSPDMPQDYQRCGYWIEKEVNTKREAQPHDQ